MSKQRGERYTVAVDFDGVLHSYTSPWVNARTIPDPPVEGAVAWLVGIVSRFEVAIYTTRSHQFLGKWAVKSWLRHHLVDYFFPIANRAIRGAVMGLDVEEEARSMANEVLSQLTFPTRKPAALVYIDDRGFRFEGTFPTADEIHRMRPWNKKEGAGK